LAEEDPRAHPLPLDKVPGRVAEGAARYNAGQFWHAHEAWEQAWHALRAAGKEQDADFVQALVLVTAGFENLRRGKPAGFGRQLDKALRWLDRVQGRGAALGLVDEAGFVAALRAVQRAAAEHEPRWLADLPMGAPALEVRDPAGPRGP